MLKFLQRLVIVMVTVLWLMTVGHMFNILHTYIYMGMYCGVGVHMYLLYYDYGRLRQVGNVIDNIGFIVILHAYSVNSCQSLLKRGWTRQMRQGEALDANVM